MESSLWNRIIMRIWSSVVSVCSLIATVNSHRLTPLSSQRIQKFLSPQQPQFWSDQQIMFRKSLSTHKFRTQSVATVVLLTAIRSVVAAWSLSKINQRVSTFRSGHIWVSNGINWLQFWIWNQRKPTQQVCWQWLWLWMLITVSFGHRISLQLV